MPFDLSLLPQDRFESASAETLLRWALPVFGRRIAVASSFGVEDVALIDMAASIDPAVRVFTLDTGRLHEQTYELMDRIAARYALKIEVLFPQSAAVEALVGSEGVNLFYDSIALRKRCCGVRKVEPLGRALATVDAWLTGLRRDQNVTRQSTAKIEEDLAHPGRLKISPLADWSEDQVWDYVHARNIPYNPLHDSGYPSIGCAPCSRAVSPGEDPRAGRWWWENPDTKECGLHAEP